VGTANFFPGKSSGDDTRFMSMLQGLSHCSKESKTIHIMYNHVYYSDGDGRMRPKSLRGSLDELRIWNKHVLLVLFVDSNMSHPCPSFLSTSPVTQLPF
jgi:hypothetical protein